MDVGKRLAEYRFCIHPYLRTVISFVLCSNPILYTSRIASPATPKDQECAKAYDGRNHSLTGMSKATCSSTALLCPALVQHIQP